LTCLPIDILFFFFSFLYAWFVLFLVPFSTRLSFSRFSTRFAYRNFIPYFVWR